MKPNVLSFFVCLFLLNNPCFSATTPTEKLISAEVDASLERTLSELEEIVNINSGTLNLDGVKQVGATLREHFDLLGFQTKWVDGSAFDRAGHLLASNFNPNEKTNRIRVLLIGHLDTVFSPNDRFQEFEVIDNNHIAGPGITDMKGGNMIIIAALRSLEKLDLLDILAVQVVLTGDEERSGKPLSASKDILIETAKWADIALGFEDGDGNIETAVIARRGSIAWELEVTGKAAHSSQIFQDEVGYGAIFESARILNEMREQLSGIGNLTFNPGLISGGTKVEHDVLESTSTAFGKNNVISQTVKVYGDIRALEHEELATAKDTMLKILTENLDQTSASIKFHEGYPPMAPTSKNRELLGLYSQVSEDLGFGKVVAVNPRNAGAADISFAADHVDMALDGLGMMGAGGHTSNEVAELESLHRNIKKAAILLHRLSSLQASKSE